MRNSGIWAAAGCLLAAGGGLLLRSQYEREQISVETTVIQTDKINKDVKAVFLTDLHSHQFGRNNARLLEAIRIADPDVVLIGGDMMVCKGTAHTEVTLSFVRSLTEHYPVYYGNGNHETRMNRERSVYGDAYDSYVRSLRAMGVIVLENRTEQFGGIAVTGMDLHERFYRKFRPDGMCRSDIENLVGAADSSRFQILLCHSPLYFGTCMEWGADLTLAGHFHGGTIRLPFFGGVMTPQFQFFLPWSAGTFEKAGKYMIVSRGLGTHSINIRINNKPQVVVVDLKKKTIS